jgi:cellulose synthase operon protein C
MRAARVSVQYRFPVAGDERARGVFFGAVFSYW